MTLPDGSGTRYVSLIWNVADDNARTVVESVAEGKQSWGMLFWVALMAGGGEDSLIARWIEGVHAKVEDRRMRSNLVGIALVFAGLAGRLPAWKRVLEGIEMTESEVVNEWISQGEVRGKLAIRRQDLLETLQERFPNEVPEEVLRLIKAQESLELLHHWFRAAIRADTFDKFLDILKR
jgi:hypothetical protein